MHRVQRIHGGLHAQCGHYWLAFHMKGDIIMAHLSFNSHNVAKATQNVAKEAPNTFYLHGSSIFLLHNNVNQCR
mgnify:FL=1